MSWERARRPEQKNERIEAILDAAKDLFNEKELTDISMQDVAKRCGLGKASVYHYFRTKEELFITLFRNQMDDWLPDVLARLKRIRRPTSNRIAAALTAALAERPSYCRLLVVFSSVLEHNLTGDFIRDFKQSLLEPAEAFTSALKEAAPHLTDLAAQQFLMQHHALVAGLWPLAHPSSEVAKVLEEEPLAIFRVEFLSLLESSLTQLLAEPS